MKSSRLLKYFEEYIKKIDMNNTWSKAKYFHSLKSMDLARIIASNFNIFNEEELVVIELIALFHDIGNFESIGFPQSGRAFVMRGTNGNDPHIQKGEGLHLLVVFLLDLD